MDQSFFYGCNKSLSLLFLLLEHVVRVDNTTLRVALRKIDNACTAPIFPE